MSGYYAVMPSYVLDDENLNSNAKLLYLEISRLCNVRGFCWAGNDFFSRKMNTSTRSIRNWLNELKNAGYVYSIVERGTRRKIFLDKRCEEIKHSGFHDAMKADLNRQVDADEDIDGVVEAAEPEPQSGGNLVPYTPEEAERSFRHNISSLEKNISKNTTEVKKADARASPDVAKEVGKKVLKAMTDQFPITRDQYPREAKNARTIANRVCEMSPDAPQEAATVVLRAFADLVEHGDGFWRKQPYTASTLVSAGIWSRVIKHIRDAQQEYDTRASPEVQEWRQFAEEVWG